MTSNPVVWFEIPVAKIDRATAFFEKAFGITLTPEMGPSKMAFFPADPASPGSGGALVQDDGYTPSKDGTLVYFAVSNIEVAAKAVAAAGGKVLLPPMSIGEHGTIAHFEDSEGNRVALHQAG